MENLPKAVFVWSGRDPWRPWELVASETGEVIGRFSDGRVERFLSRAEVREFHSPEQATAAGTLFGIVPGPAVDADEAREVRER